MGWWSPPFQSAERRGTTINIQKGTPSIGGGMPYLLPPPAVEKRISFAAA
jgi:hypothetical protein